jgi:hypothetical protein
MPDQNSRDFLVSLANAFSGRAKGAGCSRKGIWRSCKGMPRRGMGTMNSTGFAAFHRRPALTLYGQLQAAGAVVEFCDVANAAKE